MENDALRKLLISSSVAAAGRKATSSDATCAPRPHQVGQGRVQVQGPLLSDMHRSWVCVALLLLHSSVAVFNQIRAIFNQNPAPSDTSCRSRRLLLQSIAPVAGGRAPQAASSLQLRRPQRRSRSCRRASGS